MSHTAQELTANEQLNQQETSRHPGQLKAKQKSLKAKQTRPRAKQTVVQAKQTNLNRSFNYLPIQKKEEDVKSKTEPEPGGGDFPRYATERGVSGGFNVASNYTRYVSALVSRLLFYRQKLVAESAEVYEDYETKKIKKRVIRSVIIRLDQIITRVSKEKSDMAMLDQTIDKLISRLSRASSMIVHEVKDDDTPTLNTLGEELRRIKTSQGNIEIEEVRNVISPEEGKDEAFDATRGMLYKTLGLHQDRDPGGTTSIQASMFEKNMPVESAVAYLYKLLITNKITNILSRSGQTNFVKLMRLLSRPDIREVENKFIYHQKNGNQTTLREAITRIYGLPSIGPEATGKGWSWKNWVYRERSKYLFELLDNGGQASNPTRVAISLGLMDKGTWKRFITHEDEVTRLAEILEPNELAGFWKTYQPVLKRNLSYINYERIENLVKANAHYAQIKPILKAKEAEEGKDDEEKDQSVIDGHHNSIIHWQQEVLSEGKAEESGKDGDKKTYPFLDAKDAYLAAMIRNYTEGSNKYLWKGVNQYLPQAFIKGRIKELIKEVETWNKAVLKEEKKYFNSYPVIRKYILGEEVNFEIKKPQKDGEEVEDANPETIHIHNPTTKTVRALGGGSTKDKAQWLRARKFGWNLADRTALTLMLMAGFDEAEANEALKGDNASDTTTETQDLPNIDVDKESFLDSAHVLGQVTNTIRQRGLKFDPEMLIALTHIAGAAKRRDKFNGAYSWISINRRQDLFKAIMKLPDRWRVQFMSAFLKTPIEEAGTAIEADQLVIQALDRIRMVLIGLGLLPKQVLEVLGRLKYGSDITDNYLRLRRAAGLYNYKYVRAVRKRTANEPFLPQNVVQYAYLLTPQELEIAQRDREMHLGLERQFAKYASFAGAKAYPSIKMMYQKISTQLLILDKLRWPEEYKWFKDKYKDLKDNTAKDTNQWEDTEGKKYNGSYKNYYIKYIGAKENPEEAYKEQASKAKEARQAQEEKLQNLTPEEQMQVSFKQYDNHVKRWSQRFAEAIRVAETGWSIQEAASYRKMMQMALHIWQEGDMYYVPDGYIASEAKNEGRPNPYINKTDASQTRRKEAFLYEVYMQMPGDVKYKLYHKTKFDLKGKPKKFMEPYVDFVMRLLDGSLDIVEEIVKSNYRWFRSASAEDRAYGEDTFKSLQGRVLLETWTDIESHRSILNERKQKHKVYLDLDLKLKLKDEGEASKGELEELQKLKQAFDDVDQEIRAKHIPLPHPKRLTQLKQTYTSKGTYVEVVESLLMHLSDAVEYDKAFVDAMVAEGYRASDFMTLTETYKYLAVQEKEKFWEGAPTWRILTVQSTERREAASRLMSAMRNIDKARDEGKVHSELGEEKGYFYDTFFDDVMDRQESFEKTTGRYRKNLSKTIWLLGTLTVIPFGPLGFGASALMEQLILPLAFAGLGTTTSLINSLLDPKKDRITGIVGETGLAAIRSSLISAVFYVSFLLKDAFFAWDIGGESLNSLEETLAEGGGSDATRRELLWRQAAEYFGRKMARDVGKEMVRGLETAIKQGPKAGLVNFKNELLSPAFIFEVLAKTGFRMPFSNAATGANAALDKLFQAEEEPENIENESLDDQLQREARNFRASEARRTVRRQLFQHLGFKKLVKTAEFAVSNRNPLFRSFNEKFDVKRQMPLAHAHIEALKKDEANDDSLKHIEAVIVKINEVIRSHKEGQGIEELNTTGLKEVIGTADPAVMDGVLQNLREIYQTLKVGTTETEEKSQGKVEEASKAKNDHKQSKKSFSNTLEEVKEVPKNDFKVTQTSGQGNNCLIYTVAAAVGNGIGDREVTNIRGIINQEFINTGRLTGADVITPTSFLPNHIAIVMRIVELLQGNHQIRNVYFYQAQDGSSQNITLAGLYPISGQGQDIHILNIGDVHFQLLVPRNH
ncbi:MAG TPA: hypothetical protein DCS93_26855 [Microscillaceae bacterium]|nr:hypothetical protein [Microscillaceae bacterium]